MTFYCNYSFVYDIFRSTFTFQRIYVYLFTYTYLYTLFYITTSNILPRFNVLIFFVNLSLKCSYSCSYSCSNKLQFVYLTITSHLQMNIHVIIQVKKIEEFEIIQVLFKSSSIFQRFDWYNSHSQGENVEWKICITV